MSDLEARYRTVLYWYPATWREENADVVVGTLLDEADAAGRSRPRPTELLSLVLNGIGARVGQVMTISRGTRDRLAALSFGAGFAIMAIMLVGNEWAPFASEQYWPATFGPFLSAAVVINFLWIVAFGVATAGLRRWSRVVLAVAVIASVVAILLINVTPLLYARPPATALTLLIVLAVLAFLGRPTRRLLLGSAAFAAVLFAGICALQYSTNGWRFEGWLGNGWGVAANGWWAFALFAFAFIFVAVRRAEWVAPTAASATVWSLYSIGTGFTNHPDYTVVFFAVAGLIAALAVLTFASFLARGYRFQLVSPARE